MNIKNHHVYSDNFDLRVVDLTQIELATDEDKQFHIDYWAKLFKAKTWEELIMLSDENIYLYEASKTIFKLSAEDQIRKRCRDREDYYSDIRSYQKAIAERDASIASLQERIKELEAQLANQK